MYAFDVSQVPLFVIVDEVVVAGEAVFIYEYVIWFDGQVELLNVHVITGG